jgi:hypothetical protein
MGRGGALAETVALIDGVEMPTITTEKKPCDIAVTGAREGAFGAPIQLYEKVASVGRDVAASSADFRPHGPAGRGVRHAANAAGRAQDAVLAVRERRPSGVCGDGGEVGVGSTGDD